MRRVSSSLRRSGRRHVSSRVSAAPSAAAAAHRNGASGCPVTAPVVSAPHQRMVVTAAADTSSHSTILKAVAAAVLRTGNCSRPLQRQKRSKNGDSGRRRPGGDRRRQPRANAALGLQEQTIEACYRIAGQQLHVRIEQEAHVSQGECEQPAQSAGQLKVTAYPDFRQAAAGW